MTADRTGQGTGGGDWAVRAVRTGVPPAATGEDGSWSVRLCLKAAESVRLGAPVAV